ncbi:phosphatidylglycerophosphatase C [Aquimonas voraii]|uniref:Phosphatidylglycerophosphatase C n=1 Tax=Aquimonas voraii TaxID=265719 RepID=A0A1G6Y709_9GAMM|nr:phosphatidylglycerophosphatase C [Aquimonas voraii]
MVVFDFDGTLFRGDLGYEWLRWLLRQSPARLALLLLLLPAWAPLFLRRRWVQHGVRACFLIATLGRSTVSPADFLRHCGAAMRARLFPEALNVLAAERAAGHRVVIATGEHPPLVEDLLAELPGGCPPVLGSTVVPTRWGLDLRHHLQGRRKLDALEAAGYGRRCLRCYTDSATDAALIRASAEAVIVNVAVARRPALAARVACAKTALRWVD